jgi:hypothetical protein
LDGILSPTPLFTRLGAFGLSITFFTKLKEFLGGKRFYNNQEQSRKWLKELAVKVYDNGIQKLVPRLQKYLDLDGDYVEK